MKKKKIYIAPSLLSANFANLEKDIQQCINAGADMLHIDVMDGHFVPNITIGPIVTKAIKKVSTIPLSCHLMISEPDKYIESFAQAGADYISVHCEGAIHLHRTLSLIRDHNVKVGLALNPITALELCFDAVEYIDYILLMSVNPGFGGQEFIKSFIGRCVRLREFLNNNGFDRVLIEVDGGVKHSNAFDIVSAGADILVCGSGIFDGDIRTNINKLRYMVEGH